MIDTAVPARTSSPRRRKRRPVRTAVLFVALVVVLALIAGGLYAVHYYSWCQGASGAQVGLDFSIPQGASGSDVVSALNEQGVLRCSLVPNYIAKQRGLTFEAGTYRLTSNMTMDRAFGVLAKGPAPVQTVSLTIPEGYRLTQIADTVSKELGISSKAFLDLAQSGTFSLPPYLPTGTPTTEGFLFPQTYEFEKGHVSAHDVIQRMLNEFGTEAKGLPWGNAKKLGLTPYQIVIVASLIEREAANNAERPKIASVIYNRLASGTPLYIDAANAYVDPNPANGLTRSDLAMNSPYNTRLHKGLPPTPIASPGRPSLLAALKPAHTDFVYYLLCGKTHRFTPSYQQFLSWENTCL